MHLNPQWTVAHFVTCRSFDKYARQDLRLTGPNGALDKAQASTQQGIRDVSVIYCEAGPLPSKGQLKEERETTPDEQWLLQIVRADKHALRPSLEAVRLEAAPDQGRQLNIIGGNRWNKDENIHTSTTDRTRKT